MVCTNEQARGFTSQAMTPLIQLNIAAARRIWDRLPLEKMHLYFKREKISFRDFTGKWDCIRGDKVNGPSKT